MECQTWLYQTTCKLQIKKQNNGVYSSLISVFERLKLCCYSRLKVSLFSLKSSGGVGDPTALLD